MEKIDLFSCPMWQFDIPIFADLRDTWIEEIYEFKHLMPSMLISNRGGWQSPDLFAVDYRSNNLKIILNKITKQIESMFSNGYKIEVDGMWYNMNHKDSYNDLHDHPGADLAGIFYIKVPSSAKESGELVFMDPFNYNQSNLHEALNSKVPVRSFNVTPTEGRFLMFPGHLLHRVEPNQTNEDRISLAFNMIIKRPQ